MAAVRIAWGPDWVAIDEPHAVTRFMRLAEDGQRPSIAELPFELTPGLLHDPVNLTGPFARIAAVPVWYCETTHRLLYDLMGLEFPAALRVVSSDGAEEDILAVRASPKPRDVGPDCPKLFDIVFEGYSLSRDFEIGFRYRVILDQKCSQILRRNVDATFTRLRPLVLSGWNATHRLAHWPLSKETLDRSRDKHKRSKPKLDAISPKLFHTALAHMSARGVVSARELSLALGVPEQQAATYWNELTSEGILIQAGRAGWVFNEGTTKDLEKRKAPRISRREASRLIDELVERAEAINRLPEGESSIFITKLEVLGMYLDIKCDDFEHVFVAWEAEVRHPKRWPYVVDLLHPKTGFMTISERLAPKDKRIKLVHDLDTGSVDCPRMTFYRLKQSSHASAEHSTAEALDVS